MILYAEVSGCSIAVSQPPLSGGTTGAAEVIFRFDEAWAGLAKTAVFRKRGVDTLVLIQNDRCALPPEATETSGGSGGNRSGARCFLCRRKSKLVS